MWYLLLSQKEIHCVLEPLDWIAICGEEGDVPIEIETEDDGVLLLESVTVHFLGTTSLNYRNKDKSALPGVKCIEGKWDQVPLHLREPQQGGAGSQPWCVGVVRAGMRRTWSSIPPSVPVQGQATLEVRHEPGGAQDQIQYAVRRGVKIKLSILYQVFVSCVMGWLKVSCSGMQNADLDNGHGHPGLFAAVYVGCGEHRVGMGGVKTDGCTAGLVDICDLLVFRSNKRGNSGSWNFKFCDRHYF